MAGSGYRLVHHVHLDDEGTARLDSRPQRWSECRGRFNADRFDAVGLRHCDMIRRVWSSISLEHSTESGPVVRLLETGYGPVSIVVHHDPYDCNVFLAGCRQEGRVLAKS